MRSLNRLKWLHAFEATARHGSFTGAAQELGVTPAAVGQLVRSLEDWVGHPLLHRTRSGKERLTLVDEAQEALHDITQGLDKLETGLNKLRGRRSRSVVVVTASQVLMMNWLMDEEAVLVCSPHLVPSGKMACSEWLATQKLIHDDTPHPGADFPSWNDVLMAVGAPEALESGLHINSTSAVILSALSGRGVAIVRYALVKKLIETGQLVQLHPDHRWPLKWSYYLVTPQQNVMRDEVKVFHDWLLQDVVSDRS